MSIYKEIQTVMPEEFRKQSEQRKKLQIVVYMQGKAATSKNKAWRRRCGEM